MILRAKARELDFYFCSDHRARSVTTLIMMTVGCAAVILCRVSGVGTSGTAVIATVSIAAALFTRLATYEAPLPQRTATRLKQQQAKTQGRAVSRRLMLAEVPALLLVLWGYLFLPRESEADVVDNRLKYLVHSGKTDEAQRFATAASDAGIPLKPHTAKFAGAITYTRASPQSIENDAATSGVRLSPIKLETDDLIYIWRPVVYLPSGRYLITRTLEFGWASMIGDGPEMSGLFFVGDAEAIKQQIPLFRFTQGIKANVMLYNMFFEGIEPLIPLPFIDVQDGASLIAAINIRVANLSQVLDKVIWNDTRFEKCTITCNGAGFKLRNVTFADCQFSFGPSIPEELRQRLLSTKQRPIDMNFRM